MKKTRADAVLEAGAAPAAEVPGTVPTNGHSGGGGDPMAAELGVILASLQRMHEGDFSVRLPGSWVGLPGKIADTFNDIVGANELMANELARVGQAVGKEGRIRERTRLLEPKGAWRESRKPGVRIPHNVAADSAKPAAGRTWRAAPFGKTGPKRHRARARR